MNTPLPLYRMLLVTGVLFGLPSGAATAQESVVHEVHLYPGSPSASLEIAGRLVPAGLPYTVEVTTPPSLGTYADEAYRPSEAFWQAEADRLAVRVRSSIDPLGTLHTFLFSPLRDLTRDDAMFVSFEQGLPAGWSEIDDSGVIRTPQSQLGLGGQSGIRAVVSGPGTGWIRTDGQTGAGNTGYGAAGGVMIEPPPLGEVVEPGRVVVATFQELVLEVKPSPEPNEYLLRGVSLRTGSATDWTPVPTSRRIDFEMWTGKSAYQETAIPQVGPWAARFVFALDGEPPVELWIEESGEAAPESDEIRLGILEVEGRGMEGAEIVFLDWTTWQETVFFTAEGHSAEGFEGTLGEHWDVRGAVAVAAKGAIGGSKGMVASLEPTIGLSLPEYPELVDDRPEDLGSLSLLLRGDATRLNLAHGESVQLTRSSGVDGLAADRHLSVVLLSWNGELYLRARAEDDLGVIHKVTSRALQNPRFDLVVRWRAGDARSAGGFLGFWVDGESEGQIDGLDNDSRSVESTAFGVFFPTGYSASGELMLDDLALFVR